MKKLGLPVVVPSVTSAVKPPSESSSVAAAPLKLLRPKLEVVEREPIPNNPYAAPVTKDDVLPGVVRKSRTGFRFVEEGRYARAAEKARTKAALAAMGIDEKPQVKAETAPVMVCRK